MDKTTVIAALKKALAALRKISAGKTLWIWVLVIIAGIFLFKLQSGNLPGKNITLVFATWWEEELEAETLSKLAAEYEAQNHGIIITIEKMSWDSIRESLEEGKPKENSKNNPKPPPPDIFSIDPYAIHQMDRQSLLGQIDDGKDSAGNAVSIISFINPLFYNIDLLESAGFDRPPKNQTEFLSYVQRLKETGVNGAGLALSNPQSAGAQILSWIWAATGRPEPVESFNFRAKEVISTLNFLNQLKQNLYSDPFRISEAELLDAFSKGKVGMMISSVADIQELKAAKINFSITTIPSPESYAKKPVFPLTVWYVGINSKSAYQDEAKKFINYLKEKAETIAAAAYAVPGNGTLNREQSRNDPHYAKAFDMYEAGEMIRELYNSPVINSLNNIICQEVEIMFRGGKTPEQCAEAIQLEWEILTGKRPNHR